MSDARGVLTRRSFYALGAGLATIGFNRLASAAEEDASSMVTQLAKFKLNMEKETEAIEMLKELCAAVEANEPGVLAYLCHRSVKNPDELAFFEVYKDKDALKAHGRTPHMAKMQTAFLTYFRPPLEVTRLDRVGGFTR